MVLIVVERNLLVLGNRSSGRLAVHEDQGLGIGQVVRDRPGDARLHTLFGRARRGDGASSRALNLGLDAVHVLVGGRVARQLRLQRRRQGDIHVHVVGVGQVNRGGAGLRIVGHDGVTNLHVGQLIVVGDSPVHRGRGSVVVVGFHGGVKLGDAVALGVHIVHLYALRVRNARAVLVGRIGILRGGHEQQRCVRMHVVQGYAAVILIDVHRRRCLIACTLIHRQTGQRRVGLAVQRHVLGDDDLVANGAHGHKIVNLFGGQRLCRGLLCGLVACSRLFGLVVLDRLLGVRCLIRRFVRSGWLGAGLGGRLILIDRLTRRGRVGVNRGRGLLGPCRGLARLGSLIGILVRSGLVGIGRLVRWRLGLQLPHQTTIHDNLDQLVTLGRTGLDVVVILALEQLERFGNRTAALQRVLGKKSRGDVVSVRLHMDHHIGVLLNLRDGQRAAGSIHAVLVLMERLAVNRNLINLIVRVIVVRRLAAVVQCAIDTTVAAVVKLHSPIDLVVLGLLRGLLDHGRRGNRARVALDLGGHLHVLGEGRGNLGILLAEVDVHHVVLHTHGKVAAVLVGFLNAVDDNLVHLVVLASIPRYGVGCVGFHHARGAYGAGAVAAVTVDRDGIQAEGTLAADGGKLAHRNAHKVILGNRVEGDEAVADVALELLVIGNCHAVHGQAGNLVTLANGPRHLVGRALGHRGSRGDLACASVVASDRRLNVVVLNGIGVRGRHRLRARGRLLEHDAHLVVVMHGVEGVGRSLSKVIVEDTVDVHLLHAVAVVRLPGNRGGVAFLHIAGSLDGTAIALGRTLDHQVTVEVQAQRESRGARNGAGKDVVRVVRVVPVVNAVDGDGVLVVGVGDGHLGTRTGRVHHRLHRVGIGLGIGGVAILVLAAVVEIIVNRILRALGVRRPLGPVVHVSLLCRGCNSRIGRGGHVALGVDEEPALEGVAGTIRNRSILELQVAVVVGSTQNRRASIGIEAVHVLARVLLPHGIENEVVGGHLGGSEVVDRAVLRCRPALEDIAGLLGNSAARAGKLRGNRAQSGVELDILDGFHGAKGAAVGVQADLVDARYPLGNQIVFVELNARVGVGRVVQHHVGNLVGRINQHVVGGRGRACLAIHQGIGRSVVIRGDKLPSGEGIAFAGQSEVLSLSVDLRLNGRTGRHRGEGAIGRGLVHTAIAELNGAAIGQVADVHSVLGVVRTDDDGIILIGLGNVARGNIVAIGGNPTGELVVLVTGIGSLVGNDDDGVLADDIVVVDGIAVLVLHLNVNRLEHGLGALVAALVLVVHNNGLLGVDLHVEGVAVSYIDILPVFLRGNIGLVVRHPVGGDTRTTVLLDEGDAVLVDALATVGQRDGCHIARRVLALNLGQHLVAEGSNIGLGNLGILAIGIGDRQLKGVATGLAGTGKLVIGKVVRVRDRLVDYFGSVGVVHLIGPLGKGRATHSRLGRIHRTGLNRRPVVLQVLQVHRHQLIVLRCRVLHPEAGQRNIGLNAVRAVEACLTGIVLIDVLGHVGHIVRIGGDVTVVGAQTLMVVMGIGNHLAVFHVRDIEDVVGGHTVHTVGIGIVDGTVLLELLGNLRIVVRANKVDEVLLLSTVVVLHGLQGVEGRSVVGHHQVGILHDGQRGATMARVVHERTEAVESRRVKRIVFDELYSRLQNAVKVLLIGNRYLVFAQFDLQANDIACFNAHARKTCDFGSRNILSCCRLTDLLDRRNMSVGEVKGVTCQLAILDSRIEKKAIAS